MLTTLPINLRGTFTEYLHQEEHDDEDQVRLGRRLNRDPVEDRHRGEREGDCHSSPPIDRSIPFSGTRTCTAARRSDGCIARYADPSGTSAYVVPATRRTRFFGRTKILTLRWNGSNTAT